MLRARQRGETLCLHIDEAKERYRAFMERIVELTDDKDMIVGHTLPGLQYRRGRYSGFQFGVREHYNEETQSSHYYDDSPRVTFTFRLKDIVLHYYKHIDNDILLNFARIPFGDIYVAFEVNLYWWINNQSSTRERDLDAAVTRYCQIDPINRGTYHPYVKKNESSAYQNGNTCFGDLTHSILKAVVRMDFSILESLLHQWASNYTIGTTSPLNQIEYHKFGMKEEWIGVDLDPNDEDYDVKYAVRHALATEHLPASPNVCRRALESPTSEHTQSDFVENYCNSCMVQNTCDYYNENLSIDGAQITEGFMEIFDEEGFNEMFTHMPEGVSGSSESGNRRDDWYIFDFNVSRNARQYVRAFRDETVDHEHLSLGIARNIARLKILEELYQLKGGVVGPTNEKVNRWRFGQLNSHISLEALQDTIDLLKLEHQAAVESAERRRQEYDRL